MKVKVTIQYEYEANRESYVVDADAGDDELMETIFETDGDADSALLIEMAADQDAVITMEINGTTRVVS